MARIHGYRVIIRAFLPAAKTLDAQHEAITLLRAAQGGSVGDLAAKLSDVKIETRQTSYDPEVVKSETTQVRNTRRRAGAAT